LISALGLIIFAPLFLILVVIIKLDSPGPALVKLERVGQKNKHFMLYKFRSMIPNAACLKKDLMSCNERKGPLFKMKNDPRVTRFGKIIRQTSLDELPQLFNIFKGEMSLVGPRPHEPQEISRYERAHKQLLTIKPGLTGLAQISGRSELSFDKEAELDIYYIENWSLLLDLQIILMTIPVVLTKKNAV
jgi:lipopolysaccharide/colanic/teichoic acid biosynthesis glycosyltransferase